MRLPQVLYALALVLSIPCFEREAKADPITIPIGSIPIQYQVTIVAPGQLAPIDEISNSPLDAAYSSTATASLPYSAGEAIAGPNYLGVYAGAGTINDAYTNAGESDYAVAYSTDHLLLGNAPQTGYLGVTASIIGFNNDQVTEPGGYAASNNLYRAVVFTGPLTSPTITGSECVSSFSPACGSLIPGLNLLEIPYQEDSNGVVGFSQELYAGENCELLLGEEGEPAVRRVST